MAGLLYKRPGMWVEPGCILSFSFSERMHPEIPESRPWNGNERKHGFVSGL